LVAPAVAAAIATFACCGPLVYHCRKEYAASLCPDLAAMHQFQ
jgi:hypothetical protein